MQDRLDSAKQQLEAKESRGRNELEDERKRT